MSGNDGSGHRNTALAPSTEGATMATDTAPPRTTAASARRTTSPVKQAIRLARTEMTLMYRYRTALFIAIGMPFFFAAVMLSMPTGEFLPGIDAGAFNLVSSIAVAVVVLGLMYVPNVYAARREALILKRLRVSGVPSTAVFGATTLSVIGILVPQAVLLTILTSAMFGATPAAPLLLLAVLVLGCVLMTLLGISFARLARNAESAQLTTALPFFALLFTSGAMLPLDMLPDPAAQIARFLPLTPVVDIVRSAYFGYDFFGGLEGASAVSNLELWGAAGASIAVLLAWIVIAGYLTRFFKWDPREAK